MKLYQHLDLNIGPSILADNSILYVGKNPALASSWHWSLNIQDLNPKFIKLLESKNLQVVTAEVFKTNYFNQSWPIHIDGSDGRENIPKINWIYGNQECPMIWYKQKDQTQCIEAKITDTGTTYYTFDADSVEEIDRTFVRTPTIVQGAVPHTVINESGKTRWCVAIVLMKDDMLTFDQLVAEFKDYAV
jgi:hypothetical protein